MLQGHIPLRAPSDRTCSAANSLSPQDQCSPHHLSSFFFFPPPNCMRAGGIILHLLVTASKKNPQQPTPNSLNSIRGDCFRRLSVPRSLFCFMFFSPLHYGDVKSPTWPIRRPKFAAAAAFYRDFPGAQVISSLSFMSSTPQTSCKILKMENGTSDHSSACVNLCFQRNSPQMDHVLWPTYFQLMGEFFYLKTFPSTSGGGRTMQDGTRRQSIAATRYRQLRVSNGKASCLLKYLPLPAGFHVRKY